MSFPQKAARQDAANAAPRHRRGSALLQRFFRFADFFAGLRDFLAAFFLFGADFFAAYSKDKARWYGDDPVHPNLAGMDYMAQLWHDALVKSLPEGGTP